ncbi:winged helix-turn-helix transcriptional regulator [Proteus myxofaciens]|uniref:HxlR family transcriptional regulator n=1 Tax=Proteus myxofaciens ATCC 19692 TaxID=1354337 RepID=A0A198GPU9_9GAMM|nr:helix-turn-helix domain-containing protein [Proteus myxofaciens]OAT38879.1 HxlR family transcriptional regulator [Proteus myxofaciens ATCC 19692]
MDTVKVTRYETYDAEACPVEAALELISGKGKGMILYHLQGETLRFNELRRRLGVITSRVLTRQLRELESVGLINRKVYAEVPPKVEYSMTEEGKSLGPLLDILKEWGEEHALKLLKINPPLSEKMQGKGKSEKG